MIIAATVLKSIETAVQPWSDFYSNSTAVSSTVTFFHLAGLLFAGGLAVTSDRATFRALRGTEDDRSRLLADLGSAHAWVIGGLTVIFASGLLLALADVKTFGPSPIYWTKMSLVALLLINGVFLQRTEQRLRAGTPSSHASPPMQRLWTRLRFAAGASMFLWTAIVLAGVVLVEAS